MSRNSSKRVPSGGSATVNGVMYQMLWSLLRSSSARIAIPQSTSCTADELTEATLILEPIGGGGDLVVVSGNRRIVEQLKAKSGGGSWSLREVFESVIPDLYVATESNNEEIEYRFITEGTMGDWKDVYKFFRSLRDRTADGLTPTLDESAEISFRRFKEDSDSSDPVFWDEEKYTEKLLIEKLVSVVRKRKKVSTAETKEETTHKLLMMLGKFEFVGSKLLPDIQKQIDAHLLAIVDRTEDIPQTRDSLAFALARRATEGNAHVDSATFFQEQGLNALPLTNWAAVRQAAQLHSSRALELRQYDSTRDVRTQRAERIISEWPSLAPMLVVTGESGCGKSWHGFAICQLEQTSSRVSVVVSATGDVDSTLERASDVIWQEVLGHDESLSFSQISRRLRQVIPNLSFPWLTLVIEGDFEDAQFSRLLGIDWEAWGIRIVVSVPRNLSFRFVKESKGRCFSTEINDFTEVELRRYLKNTAGDLHGQMPEFLRNPLRKPLLAGLYVEIVDHSTQTWVPSTEYQVFDRFWQEVSDPIEQACLVGLADSRLNKELDGWDLQEVDQICGEARAAQRLERRGWLRRVAGGPKPRYQFGHLRLLNWACANALYQRLIDQKVTLDAVADMLNEHLWGYASKPNQLSFMPMDFLWLCCQNQRYCSQVSVLADKLTGENYNHLESIYKELLPTLGVAVLGPLRELLNRHITDPYKAHLIASAFKTIGGRETQLIAEEIIQDGNPLLQIEAARVLECASSETVLNSLWELHVAGQTMPAQYSRSPEKADRYYLYDITFEALRRCSLACPDWLSAKLAASSAETLCISDLVYLLANLPQERASVIWSKQKAKLFQIVGSDKQRCLAFCIDRVSDDAEVDWLVKTIRERVDLAGPAALRALSRIAPKLAIEQLDQLDHRDFQFTKSWFNEYLLLNSREMTQKKLCEMIMANPERAWSIASFYEQRWYFVDEQTFKLLIEKLQSDLASELSSPSDTQFGQRLYIPFRMLLEVTSTTHIALFSTYAGSQFESLLADYVVRIGPRSSIGSDGHSRNEAIEVLQRIGGNGYAKAVECLLMADNRFGRSDGLKHAGRLRSTDVAICLTAICEQQETWDGHFVEQCHAAVSLAEANVWQPVIALIRRIGLQVLRDVTRLAREQVRPTSDDLKPILDELPADLRSTPPGDILALGFGGQVHAVTVARIAKECDPKSETALACAIALECLNDKAESNVPFLARQLQFENHCFAATNALIANASDSAFEALAKSRSTEQLEAVTVNLLRKSADVDLPERIQRSVVLRIADRKTWDLVSELHFVARNTPQEYLMQEILSHSAIQEFLWSEAYADEGVVWNTGNKARAIYCLAFCDKPAAIDACKVALRNPDGRDLEYYPQLLIELDGIVGAKLLLELLAKIESEKLRIAIGRALSRYSLAELFERELNLLAPRDCEAAGFLARWQNPNAELDSQLRSWLTSNDEALSRSSATALLALGRQEEAGKVSEALVSEVSNVRKWVWIDSLLTLADIGDWHNQWPLHGPNVWECLSRSQRKYLREKLKKLREKEFK